MSTGPFNWLRRKKRGLGVGFVDMVSAGIAGKDEKKRVKMVTAEWQEGLLPSSKVVLRDKYLTGWAAPVLGLLVSVVLVVIMGRLFSLQVVNGQEYRSESTYNRVRIRDIPATRGVIYDRNGQVLATNTVGFRLVVDVVGLTSKRINEVADTLSGKLGVPAAQVRTKLGDRSQPEVVVESGITQDEALRLEVELANFNEVRVVEEPVRSYPNGKVLAHLIGYTGEINPNELKSTRYAGYSSGSKVGRSGVEESYEYLLHGRDGKEIVEVDSRGQTARVLDREDPIPGKNLVLTVDLGLTKTLEDSLDRELSITKSQKAAIIAINPQDGSVLTYISRPSFDPNIFARGISAADYATLANDPNQPLFDRVISGVYPPGSTFKPTVAVAGLSDGVISKDEKIDSPSFIKLGTQEFHNWDDHALGPQNVIDALAWSNDIYFYTVGGKLGVDRLSLWADKLGFGQKTGINLPGESVGVVPTSDWKAKTFGQPWYPGDSYNYGIGQGFLLTTPIQLVSALSTIGNGGTLYQPILIKEVRDSSNVLVSHDNPVARRSTLINADIDYTVKEGMKKACIEFVTFGGDTGCKTGTAEFGGSGQNPHGWFSVFAPWKDPQIAMVVLLEGVGHGSIYSSPVAKPVFTKYINGSGREYVP
jgi:penicillin-binding protein 2